MLSILRDDSIHKNGKLQAILDYNMSKAFVYLFNKMTRYCPYVTKTMKQYLQVFFLIATQTTVVNA